MQVTFSSCIIIVNVAYVYAQCLCSVGYMMDTVYFSFLATPIDMAEDIVAPESFQTQDCSQNYTSGIMYYYAAELIT